MTISFRYSIISIIIFMIFSSIYAEEYNDDYFQEKIKDQKIFSLLDNNSSTCINYDHAEKGVITIPVGYAATINSITLRWNSTLNLPESFSLCNTDSTGINKYDCIPINSHNNSDLEIFHPFKNNTSSFVTIIMNLSNENKNCSLCDVIIYKDPPNSVQYKIIDGEKINLVDGFDSTNPLRIFRQPIVLSMKAVNSDILSKYSYLSDFEKILAISNYLKRFKMGVPSYLSPEISALEEIGQCGAHALVLASLAYLNDIPARFIGLYNYPVNDGHVTCELFINKKWVYFDPTYGSFYCYPSNFQNQFNVLSLSEIKSLSSNDPKVLHCIVDKERYLRDLPYSEEITGLNIFHYANPSGIIGQEYPMDFPLNMDIVDKDEVFPLNQTNYYQGGYLIGATYVNSNHNWTIRYLDIGKPYVFGANVFNYVHEDNDKCFNATLEVIDDNSIIAKQEVNFCENENNNNWNVSFTPLSSKVNVRIKHLYNSSLNKYCSISKVFISKV